LNNVLQDVVVNLKETIDEAGATVELSALPVIKGIPHQLMQLFDNLLNNAIKYRQPDRQARISITFQIVKRVGLNDDAGAHDYYRICVADNGIGFDEKHAEKIFELFYRLKDRKEYAGSGIGLSICRKIVQNHGGVIQAHGKLGEGSRFDIYLPVRQG
jgi:signal transduction histidine kinase